MAHFIFLLFSILVTLSHGSVPSYSVLQIPYQSIADDASMLSLCVFCEKWVYILILTHRIIRRILFIIWSTSLYILDLVFSFLQ